MSPSQSVRVEYIKHCYITLSYLGNKPSCDLFEEIQHKFILQTP